MGMKYTIACIQVVGHAQPEDTPRFVSMEQFAANYLMMYGKKFR